jgi:hypothetical protein
MRMPYIGVRLRYLSTDFSVRLHGPRNIDHIAVEDLKQQVYKFLKDYKLSYTTSDGIYSICDWLADDLCKHYVNGEGVVWTQVETISNDGAMYGSSAEKVTT